MGDYAMNGGPVNGSPINGSAQETSFQLENHPVDDVRTIKVIVIGAGLCGITAGVLLPKKVPGIELKIIDKNSDVGGTWLENKYPGVRCDIPAHVYQSTFEPNIEWTEEFAQGHEILAYWQRIARKYDVYKYTSFRQQVLESDWDAKVSKWNLQIKDLETGNEYTEQCDAVINALGNFNAWKLPDISGLHDFKGHLRHSSNWDPTFDPTGKKLAVIGNGASGLQVLPPLQKLASHIDHYARSRTWIASSFAGDERTVEPKYYTQAQLDSFKDPSTYLQFRKSMEEKYFKSFPGWLKNSDKNNANREAFTKLMLSRISKKPELAKDLIPDFSPSCRRLTPGPGYLEAISEPNVDMIRTPISHFTETGITTVDGSHRPVDAIICCTGANVDFVPPFPIRGLNSLLLQDLWRRGGDPGYPYCYMSLAVPNFPNLFFLHGPHGAGLSGTIPSSAESQITYMCQLFRKMSTQGIRTMTPSKAATDDFQDYSDEFFKTTVLKENCSSWANGRNPGGRIHGFWPGSGRHVMFVRANPRWEDWEYTYVGSGGNRFAWLGNGSTRREGEEGGDVTGYLKRVGEADLRSHHEMWWEVY
ncbi:MAG: hypothetical protein M1834_000797 [Cirrosporium novae-zelandiae]|nr:MAG: hypothetical protein M1834_000797 [Cirrosporium novae-zelandiae]